MKTGCWLDSTRLRRRYLRTVTAVVCFMLSVRPLTVSTAFSPWSVVGRCSRQRTTTTTTTTRITARSKIVPVRRTSSSLLWSTIDAPSASSTVSSVSSSAASVTIQQSSRRLQCRPAIVRLFASSSSSSSSSSDTSQPSSPPPSSFRPGDKIQVEVRSFGPLGATVDIVATTHDPNDVLPESVPPYGRGLILQREIHYFRLARNNVDVVVGEILPAYVERVRSPLDDDDDNAEDHDDDDETSSRPARIDISLRAFGQQAKAEEITEEILKRLQASPSGTLPLGDKSLPQDIAAAFPGVSKSTFKRAVATLYRLEKVKPGPYSIALIQ